METTLHRQLKALAAPNPEKTEVSIGAYRIDAIHRGELIEVQQSSLSALWRKTRALLDAGRRVRIIKPLFASKTLVRHADRNGPEISRRRSPRHETWLDIFTELVYFTSVFPHPKLTLDLVLIDMEEHRVPRPVRRRRFRRSNERVIDRRLVSVLDRRSFRTPADLRSLLPADLREPFHTGDLSAAAGIPRWLAQKIAYVMRKTGGLELVGKQGRAWLYVFTPACKSGRSRRAA
jgi:hypothetical protein